MNERILGKDLRVSAVGLGCMGFSHAYGAPTEKSEAVKTLRDSLDLGYTFFDTAECYGPYTNEEIVGKAFAHCRDKVILATKFGVTHAPNRSLIMDSRPETIRKSVEGSLKRLKTDYIDLYYQHRIDPKIAPEEVAAVMAELIKEGKITHWGISEANEAYLRRANAVCRVTAIQNRYSMMYRDYEKLFPVLEELNIGFVAFSPLASGFLSGKYTKDMHYSGDDVRRVITRFYKENVEANQPLLDLLHEFAREKHATPAQVSLAWMLHKRDFIVPIPGMRRDERIVENLGAVEVELSDAEFERIEQALSRIVIHGNRTDQDIAKLGTVKSQ